MASKLPHLFLKNPSSQNIGFKKSRNIDPNKEEEEIKPKNYVLQKRELKELHKKFNEDKLYRVQKRTLQLPEHIDIVCIRFYKVFNLDLQKKFIQKYGLRVLSYYDFNKTVLFAIEDENSFISFHTHLQLFYNSLNDSNHSGQDYSLILLIHKLQYLNSKEIIKSYDEDIALINLIPPINQKVSSLNQALMSYIESLNIKYEFNAINYTIEAFGLAKPNIQIIAENFDNIHSISGTRAGRVRPGTLGNVIRDSGITIIPDEKAPIIGVIDTGVQNIQILKPIIKNFNIDLTGTFATWDESGHGTQVAGIIALGQDFFKSRLSKYVAKAYITPIKVLQGGEGSFSYKLLAEKIIKANKEHGIRLFNLSINDAIPKPYNSPYSEAAYLLDKLSFDNDILIFISVGNQDSEDVQALDDNQHPSHQYPNHFYCPENPSQIHDCRYTNIKPPAESLNNIAVGATADNFEKDNVHGLTPAKELPAYYTRKFHYDFSRKLNEVKFLRSQKNLNLRKPDVVFSGGDLLNPDAGLEVLSSNESNPFIRSAGTSLATPFLTSIAAEILRHYPNLHSNTVKALIINSSNSPCGPNPHHFKSKELKGVLPKLIGYGFPDREKILFSNEDELTFVIEDQIDSEEFKVIKITLPEYLSASKNGKNKLKYKATLTYKFDPIPDNHLCYCPLHISFGIFKYSKASIMANENTGDYKIRTSDKWSEDFFGIENRLISNTQQLSGSLTPNHIEAISNTIAISIKCTHKRELEATYLEKLENRHHKFSLVITLKEDVKNENNKGKLYNELSAINNAVAINTLDSDATIELENQIE